MARERARCSRWCRQICWGVYLNPDEIEKEIAELGFLDLSGYGVTTTESDILRFFAESKLLQQAGLEDEAAELRFNDGKLDFFHVSVNSYYASVAADFLRQNLLVQQTSFSFETVMSAPDKVELLAKAQQMGYRTYLYYVATDDPEINCARVEARVRQGGHPVPADKIVSRYYRSLDLLLPAIRVSDRAYLFDNSRSGGDQTWFAEVTGGHDLTIRTTSIPAWFQRAVWDKITPAG